MEGDNKKMCGKLLEDVVVFIGACAGAGATCIGASIEWTMHAPLHVTHWTCMHHS